MGLFLMTMTERFIGLKVNHMILHLTEVELNGVVVVQHLSFVDDTKYQNVNTSKKYK
jgi:hypothetical protein